MRSNWVYGVGHFFIIHILFHMAVRALMTCSPPALISSAGILSTPDDFPFFSAFTATPNHHLFESDSL